MLVLKAWPQIEPYVQKLKTQQPEQVTTKNAPSDWSIEKAPNYYIITGKSNLNPKDFPKTQTKTVMTQKYGKITQDFSDINYAPLDDLGRSGQAYGSITYGMIQKSEGFRETWTGLTPTQKQTWQNGPEASGFFRYYIGNKQISEKEYVKLKQNRAKGLHFESNNEEINIELSNNKIYHGYFYNKSHTFADSLGGRSCREGNITGTRMQNVGNNDKKGGMQYIEWKVLNYIKNHKSVIVYYKVTPNYKDNELIPRTVTVQALSSDNSIDETVVTYNAANGYTINYNDGSYTKN